MLTKIILDVKIRAMKKDFQFFSISNTSGEAIIITIAPSCFITALFNISF